MADKIYKVSRVGARSKAFQHCIICNIKINLFSQLKNTYLILSTNMLETIEGLRVNQTLMPYTFINK